MTEGHLRDVIRDNVRIEAYLDQRFEGAARPTDTEVEEYYRRHEREFVRAGQKMPASDEPNCMRIWSCWFAGKVSMIRSIVCAALLVCSVEKTK